MLIDGLFYFKAKRRGWAVRVFNDFPSALSVKAKTDNSITFSLNQPLEGMIQVVFDGRNYAEGSD
ncbi:MAG: hypothetical protein II579_00195 [Treponema sp.]|nr:hypothetical protein [Treponema sp.]